MYTLINGLIIVGCTALGSEDPARPTPVNTILNAITFILLALAVAIVVEALAARFRMGSWGEDYHALRDTSKRAGGSSSGAEVQAVIGAGALIVAAAGTAFYRLAGVFDGVSDDGWSRFWDAAYSLFIFVDPAPTTPVAQATVVASRVSVTVVAVLIVPLMPRGRLGAGGD